MFFFSDLLYDLLPISYNIFINTNEFFIWCFTFLNLQIILWYFDIFWYLTNLEPETDFWCIWAIINASHKLLAAMSSLFSIGEAALHGGVVA